MAERDYLDLPLEDFLSEVAAPTPAPGAGAVAATGVALAAGLTAMSAGSSRRQLPDADALVARAGELQAQVKRLAQRDADTYAAVLAARGRFRDDPGRPAALDAALSAASDVPLEIATLGTAVLDLAADVLRRGSPNLEGDARTACLLAQACVRAAAALVELNLSDERDPRRLRAAELVDAAASYQVRAQTQC